MSPTKKTTLNARVKLVAGPAAGLYGRIAAFDESTWSADVALDDGRKAKGVPMKHLEMIEEEAITDRDKLLDRIRKMHAKAESAKQLGNDAEAATFAAGVQKMLAKYKLSMSDVEYARIDQTEPIKQEYARGRGKRVRVAWQESLASVVARAHYCRFLVIEGSDDLIFVGRATDRTVAIFMYDALRNVATALSDKQARAFRKQQRAMYGETRDDEKGYRAAWLSAFVERIAERYRDEEKKAEVEAKKAGTSLVRLNDAKLAIEKHMSDARKSGAVSSARLRTMRTSANDAGRSAGRAAGSSVNIRGTGIGGSSSAPRKALR